jgi:NAD(P)-dependent dehydrogenase (short-subunit alcohol dehydrogenase family)
MAPPASFCGALFIECVDDQELAHLSKGVPKEYEDYDLVVATNLRGAFLVAIEAARSMKARG